ncbi:ABC-type anion transport system, duplicated permease component [Caulobacter sp. AP07]|uniref:ABC transporter permease n=1 Tax=Caulobacter sp. AP07 TaxID=1144304 RepID=UPI000271DA2A|nr:ABC transporter permease subunit [Caulobacter sp. AP07]EJL28796.1 ABC-type anion transport system, duplicated permease component [Caulobacter sp. AP07]
MVFLSGNPTAARPFARFLRVGTVPSWADPIAFLLLAAAAILVVRGAEDMSQSLAVLHTTPVTLDPARLPQYALRTTLRMFLALGASLVFTFTVATLAAKSRKAELLIVPALDILQSVPVLGFLTFTVTFFMGLFPGRQLGVECAAIFAIFTSQAWNMAFSFYQSLRSIPSDLDEVSRQFAFSPWRRFVRLELPFATPGLVWNVMMSMSGGWFFVVASEAITVGNTTVTLPGIGSWLSLAIARQDMRSVAIGVGAMAVVIVLYDQLVFRPIVAWADKFRFEQTASGERPGSWLYDLVRRTRWLRVLAAPLTWPATAMAAIDWPTIPRARFARFALPAGTGRVLDGLWIALVAGLGLVGAWVLWSFLSARLAFADLLTAFGLGLATLVRVVVLIALATAVWVPIGMWIGLRPAWAERLQPIAQFLAAFPANVMFPFAVAAIVAWRLDPNVWLSPLMVLGTQWYILFNVIAGASAIPSDLKEAAGIFGMRGWQWWRQVGIPGIFPYYVTGALTASGGSWNASVVAEAVTWGDKHLEAAGLGAFIAKATAAGDYARVALGVAVMSIFVIAFNRALWRPMYRFAERRLRLA